MQIPLTFHSTPASILGEYRWRPRLLDVLPLGERPGVSRRLSDRREFGNHPPIDEHVHGLPSVANTHRHNHDQATSRILNFNHKLLYDRGDDFVSQNQNRPHKYGMEAK